DPHALRFSDQHAVGAVAERQIERANREVRQIRAELGAAGRLHRHETNEDDLWHGRDSVWCFDRCASLQPESQLSRVESVSETPPLDPPHEGLAAGAAGIPVA